MERKDSESSDNGFLKRKSSLPIYSPLGTSPHLQSSWQSSSLFHPNLFFLSSSFLHTRPLAWTIADTEDFKLFIFLFLDDFDYPCNYEISSNLQFFIIVITFYIN
ncbi:Protein CBG11661 [Caenorhabditis briggsae]|uniref:Protein CBG11661 n=1 Tax=Caenorhabditis briggsae TaxID=6238 RepID=A8XDR3_CAEBR|nr:Protein CBG11661 [Caenorhabditis briggsae]CAP30783.2 Protein CBG11661 [Caenorhabditis briggsae]